MSTKKKHQPFKYELRKTAELQLHAEQVSRYNTLSAKHLEQLNKDTKVIVINSVGDKLELTPAEVQEKYVVGADLNPSITNVYLLRDKFTHGIYRRTATDDGVSTYNEVLPEVFFDESPSLAVLKTDEPENAGGDTPPVEEGGIKPGELNVVSAEAPKTLRGETSSIIQYDDAGLYSEESLKKLLLTKHELVAEDIHELSWITPLTSGEVMSTKHLDDKSRRILVARSEFQQRVSIKSISVSTPDIVETMTDVRREGDSLIVDFEQETP